MQLNRHFVDRGFEFNPICWVTRQRLSKTRLILTENVGKLLHYKTNKSWHTYFK